MAGSAASIGKARRATNSRVGRVSRAHRLSSLTQHWEVLRSSSDVEVVGIGRAGCRAQDASLCRSPRMYGLARRRVVVPAHGGMTDLSLADDRLEGAYQLFGERALLALRLGHRESREPELVVDTRTA